MSPMASSVPVDSSDEEDTECFGSGRAAVLLVFASADADADAFLQPIQVCELAWFIGEAILTKTFFKKSKTSPIVCTSLFHSCQLVLWLGAYRALDYRGLAKTPPHILTPELFAHHLGASLLGKYAHFTKAFVIVEQLRWARISVGTGAGAGIAQDPHPHSYWRDGDDKQTTKVVVDATKGKDAMTASAVSGISDLLGACKWLDKKCRPTP